MAFKPFASGHDLAAADVNDLVGVYDRSTGTVDVNTSVVETSIYSKSIGAAHMSTDRMLRATILGDYLNNTGGNTTFIFKLKFGGTTLIEDATNTFGTNAARRPFRIVVEVANLGVNNSQYGIAHIHFASVGATTGIGDLSTPVNEVVQNLMGLNGTSAIATASAQTFDVTVTLSSSSANHSLRKKYAALELL